MTGILVIFVFSDDSRCFGCVWSTSKNSMAPELMHGVHVFVFLSFGPACAFAIVALVHGVFGAYFLAVAVLHQTREQLVLFFQCGSMVTPLMALAQQC